MILCRIFKSNLKKNLVLDWLLKFLLPEHLVFIQGGAATPMELLRAMTEHGVCNNLRGVRLLHMGLEGDAPFASPEFQSTIFCYSQLRPQYKSH